MFDVEVPSSGSLTKTLMSFAVNVEAAETKFVEPPNTTVYAFAVPPVVFLNFRKYVLVPELMPE